MNGRFKRVNLEQILILVLVLFVFCFMCPNLVSSQEEETNSMIVTDLYLAIKYSRENDALIFYNHGKRIFVLKLAGLDFDLNEFLDNLEKKFTDGEISYFDHHNRPLDKRRIEEDYKKNYMKVKKEALEKVLREQGGNKNPKKPRIDSATINGAMASNGGSYVLNEGEALSLNISADDQDAGDTVTIITPSAPTVGTFTASAAANPGTATFTFTPAAIHVGMTYTFSLRAEDNNGGVSVPDLDISIEVNVSPDIPAISQATISGSDAGTDSAGIYTITDGQEIVLNFSASDSNGSDTVTLSTPTSPTVGTFTAGAAANPGTAMYTFQPFINHVNQRFEFMVRSTDNRGGVSTSDLFISVRVNPSPQASDSIQAGDQILQQEVQALVEAQLEAENNAKQTEESLELEGMEEESVTETEEEIIVEDTSESNNEPNENEEVIDVPDQNPSETPPTDTLVSDTSMSEESEEDNGATVDIDEILEDIDKIKEIKETEFAKPKTGKQGKQGKSNNEQIPVQINNIAYAGSQISFVVPNELFGNLTLADLVSTPCNVAIIDSGGKEYLIKVLSLLPNSGASAVTIKGGIVPKDIAQGAGTLIVIANGNPIAKLGIQIVNNLMIENIESTQPPEIQTVEVEKKNNIVKFKISGSNFPNKTTTVSVMPSNGLVKKEITIIKGKVIVAVYQTEDNDVKGAVTIGVTNPYGQAFHQVLIP